MGYFKQNIPSISYNEFYTASGIDTTFFTGDSNNCACDESICSTLGSSA